MFLNWFYTFHIILTPKSDKDNCITPPALLMITTDQFYSWQGIPKSWVTGQQMEPCIIVLPNAVSVVHNFPTPSVRHAFPYPWSVLGLNWTLTSGSKRKGHGTPSSLKCPSQDAETVCNACNDTKSLQLESLQLAGNCGQPEYPAGLTICHLLFFLRSS